MSENINIKVASENDWIIIQKLNTQVYLADKDNDEDLILDQPFSEKNIKYYKNLASGEYGHCAIAYIEETPVGYIAIAQKRFGHRKGNHYEIENMGVDEPYRSRGIGKSLMQYAENWAREQGASKLYVVAYWGNKQAINFYKKTGFSEIALELEKRISS